MIKGLKHVARSFNGMLVPIAKYTITNTLNEDQPKIMTGSDYGKQASLNDLQTDVYQTMPAIENVFAVYDDKIITAYQKYDNFNVECYGKTREDAKAWMDNFESNMIKKNQYRGKCLYAENNNIEFKDIPQVSWDDVVLAEKVKKDIHLNTVEFLGDVKYASAGIMKRGLILYGPPGTGKTSVVKSIFKELEGKNVSRIYVTAESFRYMPMGNLFQFLSYLGSSVLAFEDIDMVSGNRDIHTASNMLGDLLTNLDGMRRQQDPLVVIASTNKIEMMDSALANRPCRFDRKVELGLPGPEHLKIMYSKHMGQEVSDEVIRLSQSFTGSHVVETVNTAKILATSESKKPIECLKDACNIIRENFFPGQNLISVQAAIQRFLVKKGFKKSATKDVESIVSDILKGL